MEVDIDLQSPKGAIFSEDRKFRYSLWRMWGREKPLLFIGLNPSTANEIKNDATITRSMSRAVKLGFGGLLVGNLYSLVSTNPKELLGDGDFGHAIGEFNDYYLREMVRLSGQIICGWGSFPAAKLRVETVIKMIPEPYCLGVNADGQPKHPLYIGYDTPMIKFPMKVKQ